MAVQVEDPILSKMLSELSEIETERERRLLTDAIEQRRGRLSEPDDERTGRRPVLEVLNSKIWPAVPPHLLGTAPLAKQEEEELLGLNPSDA